MKNARILQSSAIGLAAGILLVIAGRAIIDSYGQASYATSIYGSVSTSMLLYAGYMLMGLSILGFIVAILKD